MKVPFTVTEKPVFTSFIPGSYTSFRKAAPFIPASLSSKLERDDPSSSSMLSSFLFSIFLMYPKYWTLTFKVFSPILKVSCLLSICFGLESYLSVCVVVAC